MGTIDSSWLDRMAAREKADSIVDIVNRWRAMDSLCPDVSVLFIEPVIIRKGIDILADAVEAELKEESFTNDDGTAFFYYHFDYRGVRFGTTTDKNLALEKGDGADGGEENGG